MIELRTIFDDVIPNICFFVGILIWLIYIYSHTKISFGEKYVKAKGKIIRSKIKEILIRDKYLFKADVKYEFKIKDTKYESIQVYKYVRSIGSTHINRVEKVTKKYFLNKVVDVYYLPSNKSKSYLQESTELGFGWVVTGIIMIGIGIVIQMKLHKDIIHFIFA